MCTLLTPRAVTLAGMFLLLLGHVAVLSDHVWHLEKFRAHVAPYAASILKYCYAVSLFGIIPVGWLLVRLQKDRTALLVEVRSWLPVRAWLYCVFLAIAISSIAHALDLFQNSRFLTRSFFESTLLGCLDVWALLTLFYPSQSPQGLSRFWGYVDVPLMNVILTVLLAEGAVNLWASYSTSHLPIDATSIRATVETFRPEPYRRYFNFNLNSGGYHDDEFFTATEKDFVVALLADSFGLGVVPYAYNFATITEKHLQDALGGRYDRVAVHNFGIPGIDTPEYAFLLHTEVLQMNPARVVLCVFVGNDIRGLKPKNRRRFIFQNWRLWKLTTGIVARVEEGLRDGEVLKIGKPMQAEDAVPAYILDPSKERPSTSERNFLNIESQAVEIVNPNKPSTQRKYREFLEALAKFHSWLGDRLIVVVIPDEFQVNDELYQRVLATKPNPDDYMRDYPQQRLRAFCEKRGIPMLDLLPALREANKEEHVYHLRDTHWNARGNRVAGHAIARFLLEHHEAATSMTGS